MIDDATPEEATEVDPTAETEIPPPPRRLRGFAALSKERLAEIVRRGGHAVQASGRAHKWTPESARVAAGLAVSARRARAGMGSGNHG